MPELKAVCNFGCGDVPEGHSDCIKELEARVIDFQHQKEIIQSKIDQYGREKIKQVFPELLPAIEGLCLTGTTASAKLKTDGARKAWLLAVATVAERLGGATPENFNEALLDFSQFLKRMGPSVWK